jgi:hypothetical protein
VVGIGWSCVQQINIVLRAGTRSVVEAQYATLNPDADHRYTGDDVRKHMRETAQAMYRIFPSPLRPTAFIFSGVLLLVLARRSPQTAAN